MNTRTLTAGAFAILLLAGCQSFESTYTERPVETVLSEATVAPDARKDALPNVNRGTVTAPDDWWTRFGDAALTGLIGRAYASNRTFAAARANLRAARAAWKYQRGTLWPSVDANGGVMRNRTSDNGRGGRQHFTDYTLSADATWELDFFGRNYYSIEAAKAQAEAAEADMKSVWVTISSEVALRYIDLRTLQGRLMIAEDTLEVQQANYDLLTKRWEGGIGTELDRIQAEYDLRTTAAAIPSLKGQIVAAENALAILCGVTPGTLPEDIVRAPRSDVKKSADGKKPSLRPTGIPVPEPLALDGGIPANAIRNRPDVISAERALKAASEMVGDAKADKKPSFFISGSLGLNALHLSDVLDWDSHFYRFGPGVSLPIFRGGQINANIEIRTEQQRAALAAYEHTVFAALGDIRTALSGYVQQQERLSQLRAGTQAAATAYQIAYNAYTNGNLRFFEVLDAQRRLFNLDDARVSSEGAIAQAQVSLYKALCGGWDAAGDPNASIYFFGEDGQAPDTATSAPLLLGAAAEVEAEKAKASAAEVPAAN